MAAAKFVIMQGNTGKYRFNLLATNGQVVATSEAYETKRAALAGVESVRKIAASAPLVDETPSAEPTGVTAVKKAAGKAAVTKAAGKTAVKKAAGKATDKKATDKKSGAKKSGGKKSVK